MQQFIKDIKFKEENLYNQDIVKSIVSIANEKNNIVIEVKDIQEALENASVADVQVVEANGEGDAILQAMQTVVSKLDSLENIGSVFIKFDIHPDVSLLELVEGIDILANKLDEKVGLIFGTECDTALSKEDIKVSVLCFYK